MLLRPSHHVSEAGTRLLTIVRVDSLEQVLEVLRRLENRQHINIRNIQAGKVMSVGSDSWVIALNNPLLVYSVYTGSY